MRNVNLAPSLVPSETVYLVLDDFGKLGQSYRETDPKTADIENVIDDFLTGQFAKPVRVIAFNTAEGWSLDVSESISWEVLKRSVSKGMPLPDSTRQFVIFHLGENDTLRAENAVL